MKKVYQPEIHYNWVHDTIPISLFYFKGSLHSKDAQSYMTPSPYLCVIVHNQSCPTDIFLPNWERGCPAVLDVSVISTLQQLTLKYSLI